MDGGTAAGTTARKGIGRWWRDCVAEPVLSVLFPPRCVGCGDFESYLCDGCRETLQPIGSDPCPRCGEPGPAPLVGGRCARCMGEELSYVSARGAFHHLGLARRMVADFKFGGQPVLGRVMADASRPWLAEYVSSLASLDRLFVTWVPCRRSAERERGYNQAEVLARNLASGSALTPPAGLVCKTRATKHQKGLGRADRQENLRGAFALDKRASALVPSRTQALLVVDDVYTTGATAREVSSVLGQGMGLPVHFFTFSRVVAGTVERHD